ncbi:MAG: hypothetical protein IJ708_02885 [Clostridia bacterium]|nr:hypothetical protein [Clostridia bacterium]
MTIKITGKLDIEKAARAVDRACLSGLPEAAELLLSESNVRVPVKTGALRDSGEAKCEGRSAAVTYSAPYAVPVHENLLSHHTVGEAKFLEHAANSPAVQREMAEALGRALRKEM